MDDSNKSRGTKTRWAGAAGLLAAGAISGGVLASTLSAGAATSSTSSNSEYSSSSSTAPPARPNFPTPGSAAHEDAEKPVTGANATKAQAAAVKAVGSGKAGAVTTDYTGNGYEVTVTKSDGSTVEVHMDASFNVQGGPNGPGGYAG
jgi:hypothetical protein